jgi:hypothetical protein
MNKPTFCQTSFGRWLVIQEDYSVIAEINGQLHSFDDATDYRKFERDEAEWRTIEDDETIADLTRTYLKIASRSRSAITVG